MKLRCKSRCSPVATLLAVLTAGGLVQAKATFIINNIDPAGVGFNDTTPVTPVGGNIGTTLGQQRLIVFQAAADTWGRVLESAIPIVVDASFAPLDCTNNAAIAGLGWPNPVANVAGLPANTQYPLALANRLLGVDLSPGTASIQAQFNSDLKACLGMDWYYGLDSKTSKTQADLFNTVKHELTHGLGFLSGIADETVGAFWNGYPTIYSANVLDTTTGKHWSDMTIAERLASTQNVRNVVWDGKRVQAVAAWFLAKGLPSVQTTPALAGFSGVINEANFGPLVADGSAITGPVVFGTTATDCTFIPPSYAGKIAVITALAQCDPIYIANGVNQAGALATLLAYNQTASPPPVALDDRIDDIAKYAISIPTLAVTLADANTLQNSGGNSVTVTLSADSSRLVGTDSLGRTLLFASNPIQAGASGSHWDPLLRPMPLMAPSAPYHPVFAMEMERAVLWDIGWTGSCGNGAIDAQEECDSGVINSDFTPDACRLDCTKPKCGDGVVDNGEQCDPGSAGSAGTAKSDNPNCGANCKLTASTGGASGIGGMGGGSGGTSGSAGASASSSAAGKGGAGSGGSGPSGGRSNTGAGGSSTGAAGRSGGVSNTGAGDSSTGAAGQSGGVSNTGATSSSTGGAGQSGDRGNTVGGNSNAAVDGNTGTGSSSGCGCRMNRTQSSSGMAILMAGLGLIAARRVGRRRR